nr:putative ribonuclease H-like domain-containing protein [Tanacetum cinerariifolium]
MKNTWSLLQVNLKTLTVETPIPTASSPVLTVCFSDSQEPSSATRLILKRVTNQEEIPSLDNILTLTNQFEDILGDTSNSKESNGVEVDVSYMEKTIIASPTPTLRIHREHPKKPKKVFDALQDPSWVEFMQEELFQFKIQKVWSLVDCPKGVRPIGTKWVLKNKKDERGIVIKNKARLMAQRHTQEEGIDYDEVFASVTRIEAIRLFLAYASFMGFTVYQMDVKSAFLYGTIDEEVYVMQPPGIQDPEYPARVYKVEKTMYGLHQAPRALHTAKTLDLVWIWLGSDYGNVFLNGFYWVLVGEGSGTPTEPHHTPSQEAQPSSPTHISTSSIPTVIPIPTVTQYEPTPLRHYTQRAKIAQSSDLPPVADEPASPVRDVSKGEACPTDSGFIADQDRATIDKSSTLPHDTAPHVTSLAAVEGSMQLTINELTALCTSLQRQHSELLVQFKAQEVEINKLKERVKILEDNQGVIGVRSADDAPIKGRRIAEEEGITGRVSSDTEEIRMDEGEVAVERTSEDTEEMATILTSMDVAIVLAGGINVPTGSYSIPTASPLLLTFTLAVMRFPLLIARDAKVARIHAEEELQGMIDSLDRTNETIAKYLQEYQDFASELPLERRIELISDLKKTVIRNNLGWKVKDFKGMTFEEIEEKFVAILKLVQDFIHIGLKEEDERLKRKGFNLEQEKAKKQKTLEEVPNKEKSPEDIPEEKVKEMMQLIPIEEVYVQALQVKHPVIDWKVHIEGQMSY